MDLLSVTARSPVIRRSVDSFTERLQTESESWTISVRYGYNTASIALKGSIDYLTEWFTNGLVRDITFRDRNGAVRWEGYVEKMSLFTGGVSRSRNVKEMANRIILVYRADDTAQNPPQTGGQAVITKNDSASQTIYGVKSVLISGGEVTAATADDKALSRLSDLSYIREEEKQTFLSGNPLKLSLQLAGYSHMTNWFNYSQVVSSGTVNASAINLSILQADPNSVISTSGVDIDLNTLQVKRYQDGKTPSWNLIQKVAELGREVGGIGERWVGGIYIGRRLIYKRAEGLDSNGNFLSSNKYLELTRHVSDVGHRIVDEASREVFPWEVLPDRLIKATGIPGRHQYIEGVKYTAPFGLQVSGTDATNVMAGVVRA